MDITCSWRCDRLCLSKVYTMKAILEVDGSGAFSGFPTIS